MEPEKIENLQDDADWERAKPGYIWKERLRRFTKEWLIPFGTEILALLLIIKFLFFFVIVPSGSMIPTIEKPSVLFATRVHNPEKLQRGDIVVFESDELNLTLVKRLVGLPGDHVVLDEDGNPVAGANVMDLHTERSMELRQNIRDYVDENMEVAALLIKSWLKEDGDNG